MMATTHLLAGLAVAAVASILAPETAAYVVFAGALGGLVPDLDLYAGHRRTLHFPIYGPIVAAVAVLVAVVVPTPETVALAVFLVAFGLHSFSDVFGGGLELRPWEGTSDRAVFSHFHGSWWAPRRFVRYDGAPEDLVLAGLLAIPSVIVFDGQIDLFIVGVLALSTGYVLIRKPIVRIAEWVVARIPAPILEHIPERFVEDIS